MRRPGLCGCDLLDIFGLPFTGKLSGAEFGDLRRGRTAVFRVTAADNAITAGEIAAHTTGVAQVTGPAGTLARRLAAALITALFRARLLDTRRFRTRLLWSRLIAPRFA